MKKFQSLGLSFIVISIFLFFLNFVNNFNISGNVIKNADFDFNNNLFVFLILLFFVYGVFMFLLNGLEKIIEKEVKVKSKVKQDPLLLTVAKEVGKNPIIKKEINHLIDEFFRKGNSNPGLGTKYVDYGISELRGRNGGRVYFRINSYGEYEVLGYSDKYSQEKVIERLRTLYKPYEHS